MPQHEPPEGGNEGPGFDTWQDGIESALWDARHEDHGGWTIDSRDHAITCACGGTVPFPALRRAA
jgi:hypothetical protein